jgi:hypothetical protein
VIDFFGQIISRMRRGLKALVECMCLLEPRIYRNFVILGNLGSLQNKLDFVSRSLQLSLSDYTWKLKPMALGATGAHRSLIEGNRVTHSFPVQLFITRMLADFRHFFLFSLTANFFFPAFPGRGPPPWPSIALSAQLCTHPP